MLIKNGHYSFYHLAAISLQTYYAIRTVNRISTIPPVILTWPTVHEYWSDGRPNFRHPQPLVSQSWSCASRQIFLHQCRATQVQGPWYFPQDTSHFAWTYSVNAWPSSKLIFQTIQYSQNCAKRSPIVGTVFKGPAFYRPHALDARRPASTPSVKCKRPKGRKHASWITLNFALTRRSFELQQVLLSDRNVATVKLNSVLALRCRRTDETTPKIFRCAMPANSRFLCQEITWWILWMP